MMNTTEQTKSEPRGAVATQPALKDAFKNDFYIGAALSLDQINGKDPEAMALVAKQFNSITPENILKWEEVHPEPDRYNFEAPDRYVAFGEKHGMHVIGHTLVWWHQTPDWVFQDKNGGPVTREVLLERMKEHIFTVMGRYRGRIRGWDVVNEAINADGSWRQSRWYKILGEEHVAKAFEFAREADPQAELYYNEFDLENRPKCEGVVRLIKGLQAKGVKMDGIGIQGHWFLDYPPMEEIEHHFNVLGELGPKLMITELDIGVLPYYPLESKIVDISSFDTESQKKHNPYPNGLPDEVEQKLSKRYADLFSLLRKQRGRFGRVTFWAVDDKQSWRNYWPITGRADYPMLFDRHGRPKPAFDAVVKVGSQKG
jgi:endo-1,4-beta-xylanase